MKKFKTLSAYLWLDRKMHFWNFAFIFGEFRYFSKLSGFQQKIEFPLFCWREERKLIFKFHKIIIYNFYLLRIASYETFAILHEIKKIRAENLRNLETWVLKVFNREFLVLNPPMTAFHFTRFSKINVNISGKA